MCTDIADRLCCCARVLQVVEQVDQNLMVMQIMEEVAAKHGDRQQTPHRPPPSPMCRPPAVLAPAGRIAPRRLIQGTVWRRLLMTRP